MILDSQGHRLHLFMSEGAGRQSPGHKTEVYGSKMAELRTASAAWRVGVICYQQQITNACVGGKSSQRLDAFPWLLLKKRWLMASIWGQRHHCLQCLWLCRWRELALDAALWAIESHASPSSFPQSRSQGSDFGLLQHGVIDESPNLGQSWAPMEWLCPGEFSAEGRCYIEDHKRKGSLRL